jgi:hypothetical protein
MKPPGTADAGGPCNECLKLADYERGRAEEQARWEKHSDRVHRHARWILEAARRRLGEAAWHDGPIALLRIEFNAYSTRAEWVSWAYDDWFPCTRATAATLLRGLLHTRLCAEAVEDATALLLASHQDACAALEIARDGQQAALRTALDRTDLAERYLAEAECARAGESAALSVLGARLEEVSRRESAANEALLDLRRRVEAVRALPEACPSWDSTLSPGLRRALEILEGDGGEASK